MLLDLMCSLWCYFVILNTNKYQFYIIWYHFPFIIIKNNLVGIIVERRFWPNFLLNIWKFLIFANFLKYFLLWVKNKFKTSNHYILLYMNLNVASYVHIYMYRIWKIMKRKNKYKMDLKNYKLRNLKPKIII